MKKDKIKLGGIYHNGKSGRFYTERKIVGVGPGFLLYCGQEDTDCVRYLVVRGKNLGGQSNMTRTSFASWAKGEVEHPELLEG